MCIVRAKVVINGSEDICIANQEYFFTGEPQEAFLKATSYAQGYAFACMEGKFKMDLQNKDFVWWMRGTDFRIEVLNMKDENIKTEEDLL